MCVQALQDPGRKGTNYLVILYLSFVVRSLSCSSATPLPSWEHAQCFPRFYNTLHSYLCSDFSVPYLVPTSCRRIALPELCPLKAEPTQLYLLFFLNQSSVVCSLYLLRRWPYNPPPEEIHRYSMYVASGTPTFLVVLRAGSSVERVPRTCQLLLALYIAAIVYT